jgi:hypothetical protein
LHYVQENKVLFELQTTGPTRAPDSITKSMLNIRSRFILGVDRTLGAGVRRSGVD